MTGRPLRILVVSNRYPPHHVGGYEIACAKAVEALRGTGHEVAVLTGSTHGAEDGEGVFRRLSLIGPEWGSLSLPRRLARLARMELENRRALKELLAAFGPEVVYLWNLADTSFGLALHAQAAGVPVAMYVFDVWLAGAKRYNRSLRLWTSPPVRVLTAGRIPAEPDLSHTHFVSDYLKRATLAAGYPVARAEVVHWGVDLPDLAARTSVEGPVRILCSGQVVPHKGVDVVIEALAILGDLPVELTIAGGTTSPAYVSGLRSLASRSGLAERVGFVGALDAGRLADAYLEHDVLVFASRVAEGLPLTLLEAMAHRLAVVSTSEGGSAEILRDGVNALVFPRDDHTACARHIRALVEDAELRETIAANGRRTVEEGFLLERAVERIESLLQGAARA
jgi:glycogen(starch) synthase